MTKGSQPDLSIVIPVHNGEGSIGECLQSILDQTCADRIEVICIDDASADATRDILSELGAAHPGVVRAFRNEDNLGPGLSRDRGVDEASGAYLMFCDSDDRIAPDYCERMLDAMEAEGCDILIGTFTNTDGEHESVQELSPTDWTVLNFSAPWGKVYKTDFIKKNGIRFSDFRFAEDTYFTLQALCAGASYGFTDNAGYFYMQNPESITRSKAYDKGYEAELSKMYRALLAEVGYESLTDYQQRLLEYSYISDMLNTLVMYDGGCGRELMGQKADFFLSDLRSLFPDYRSNPYIGLLKPAGQRPKIRLGMGAFMLADKMGMAKRFLMLFA